MDLLCNEIIDEIRSESDTANGKITYINQRIKTTDEGEKIKGESPTTKQYPNILVQFSVSHNTKYLDAHNDPFFTHWIFMNNKENNFKLTDAGSDSSIISLT